MPEDKEQRFRLWPFILLGLFAAAFWQLDAAFPTVLRDEDSAWRLIYLAILLVILVLFSGNIRKVKVGQTLKMAMGWVGLFAIMLVAYSYRHEARGVYDRVRGELIPTLAVTVANGETVLSKTWDGHYRAEAKVNGTPVRVLVDTGASIVVLTYEDANRLGLAPGTLSFDQPVRTANGRSYVASVTLDHMHIGNIGLARVSAAVAEKGKLETSLLGMSFLGELQEVSFRADKLYLRN